MSQSWWDWWWNNIGLGGVINGSAEKRGEKAGEKIGDAINSAAGTPDVSGAMSAINDSVSFAKAVWLNVSDYRMWRSLGWLLLGVLLMILGFVVWNRKALGKGAAKLGLGL